MTGLRQRCAAERRQKELVEEKGNTGSAGREIRDGMPTAVSKYGRNEAVLTDG